jgi:hypothetical protein
MSSKSGGGGGGLSKNEFAKIATLTSAAVAMISMAMYMRSNKRSNRHTPTATTSQRLLHPHTASSTPHSNSVSDPGIGVSGMKVMFWVQYLRGIGHFRYNWSPSSSSYHYFIPLVNDGTCAGEQL